MPVNHKLINLSKPTAKQYLEVLRNLLRIKAADCLDNT